MRLRASRSFHRDARSSAAALPVAASSVGSGVRQRVQEVRTTFAALLAPFIFIVPLDLCSDLPKPFQALYGSVPAPDDALGSSPQVSCALAPPGWDAILYMRDEFAAPVGRALAYSWGRRRVINSIRIAAAAVRERPVGAYAFPYATSTAACTAAAVSSVDAAGHVGRLTLPAALTAPSSLLHSGPDAIRFVVDGAGTRVVNGVYSLSKLQPHDGCAVFVRQVGSLTLVLTRFAMQGGHHQVRLRYRRSFLPRVSASSRGQS